MDRRWVNCWPLLLACGRGRSSATWCTRRWAGRVRARRRCRVRIVPVFYTSIARSGLCTSGFADSNLFKCFSVYLYVSFVYCIGKYGNPIRFSLINLYFYCIIKILFKLWLSIVTSLMYIYLMCTYLRFFCLSVNLNVLKAAKNCILYVKFG
jgi:hypothetical protein